MVQRAASVPRGLSEEEAQAWADLAQSVTPFEGRSIPQKAPDLAAKGASDRAKNRPKVPPEITPRYLETPPRPAAETLDRPRQEGLDGSWEKKLRSGNLAPDVTLDLHGHNLDSAYHRLDAGLAQAVMMGARVVLLIAGKSRPVDPADRGQRRGAIRAKVLDWLAAGPHASNIAAIRKAHRRHGGEGALYLVLKRRR